MNFNIDSRNNKREPNGIKVFFFHFKMLFLHFKNVQSIMSLTNNVNYTLILVINKILSEPKM